MPEADRSRSRRNSSEEGEERWARRWPWVLPLAAGIFLGGAAFDMLPEGLHELGRVAWLWALAGLALFILVRDGLDYVGKHGAGWVATLGLWLHSLLEGVVAALGFGAGLVTGLLVTGGLILHLLPEAADAIALMTATGVSRQQSLLRLGVTYVLLVGGFVAILFFLPGLSEDVVGAALALGAGGFVYLAYLSWKEHEWERWPSLAVVVAGLAAMGAMRLVTE